MNAAAQKTPRSPWPARLAAATLLCALPLVLFGGSVTTLGAGMAVEGWLIAEGHFLLFFPIESWLRDVETFVEHTHRLFAILVGLIAIAGCVATWRCDIRRSARTLSALTLAAISGQGALGGFRVLESSPQLAFLHGVIAQAVFALIAVNWLVATRAWASGAGGARGTAAPVGLRPLAVATTAVVFGQVFLGAWYRHAIRPVEEAGAAGKLGLHVVGALLVFVLVAAFAGALARAAARAGEPGADRLRRAARSLVVLLLLQLLLGAVAWAGYRPDTLGPAEWAVSILHVLGGALLLSQTVVATLWTWRAFDGARRAGAADATDVSGVTDAVGEAVAMGASR